MPYSFTPTINPFVISSLFDSIKTPRPNRRFPNTSYSVSAQVINNGNRYICSQAGITSTGAGPSGSSGTFVDGTVRWVAMGPDTVQDGDIISNLYVSLGKQTEWDNPTTPDNPDASSNGQKEVLDDATVFIRLDASNVRIGIDNNTWESGVVYSQYDPEKNQLSYTTPHYCIVGNSIYKCLDNNRGTPSLDAPSGVASSLIETSDGYIWKYIGEISDSDQFDFSTSLFVPAPVSSIQSSQIQGEISTFTDLVSTGTFNDDDTIQVSVVGNGTGATAAVRTTTAGENKTVNSIYATSGGNNYTTAYAVAWKQGEPGSGAELELTLDGDEVDAITVDSTGSSYTNASVIIIGDGTGATATANVVGGQVTSVIVDTVGSGYTWARAIVVPGEAGAAARAVFSPTNGHGSSVITELGARALLISTKLAPSLNNYIPTEPINTDGSFRQIGLISGVQGSASSDRNAEAYLGKSHPAYESSPGLNKYKDGSGFVLYINNIASITHTSSQEEIIKISISL